MTEPTRRLPDPEIGPDGKLIAKSVLTPKAMKTRGAIPVPPNKVIPVIVVPGIMGSNLRANTNERLPQNEELKRGDPAWRPPNGILAGLAEATEWKGRDPRQRQKILDGDTLEVDDQGLIDIPGYLNWIPERRARQWGWGEVHWDSYGGLLCELQRNLNSTFTRTRHLGKTTPNDHWDMVMRYDRSRWSAADMPALTEVELKKFAEYQYPVYACGYNWVQSNELSAERLKKKVLDVIAFWSERKYECKQVILVTHSMGGLVARACAKQIPEKIVGIVHGVMPALGAPLCYRRIACGTESSAPGKSWDENIAMAKFSEIAGDTTEKTTPTMATACGPLELLPNHLYPSPWLFASMKGIDGKISDLIPLHSGNPYDLYRDIKSWYRLINPALADPAKKYKKKKGGGVVVEITKAINQAEKFHTKVLDSYYHPNTYAYYGVDNDQLSFGKFCWVTTDQAAATEGIRKILPASRPSSHTFNGGRNVELPSHDNFSGGTMHFLPSEQDTAGDGTVSQYSGAGPQGKIKRLFGTRGYDHQSSYKNGPMLALTKHLIVKMAQEAA
ncbi:esterase/lipase family protein [Massilia sp. DD77]|uniref:esterase/lipase family protein n=1 Tax=Massilia sp. DD77 TaxID=3109349 RepID=UPI002FFEC743